MFASTNVLTPRPLFGATPFVERLNTTPPIDSVDDAFPVTVPPVADVNVTEHCPAPFVVRLNGPAGFATAPLPFVSVTLQAVPAGTGTKPLPVSCSTVTVNVCGAPTSFVAFGAIEIRAFTQFFVASELSPACASPVERVRVTPPTVRVVVAWIVVCP